MPIHSSGYSRAVDERRRMSRPIQAVEVTT
jgi:hypothetical protein